MRELGHELLHVLSVQKLGGGHQVLVPELLHDAFGIDQRVVRDVDEEVGDPRHGGNDDDPVAFCIRYYPCYPLEGLGGSNAGTAELHYCDHWSNTSS